MEENITSALMDISGHQRAFIQFDYDYFEDWDDTEARCCVRGKNGLWQMVDFYPWNAQVGCYFTEITEQIAQEFQFRFYYKSNVPDNHFAIDNVVVFVETEEPVSNNILGFRLWLDGVGGAEERLRSFAVFMVMMLLPKSKMTPKDSCSMMLF